MMKVEDFSKCCNTQEAIDLNPLAPKFPFRLLIIGPSGSGKTNMLINLILKNVYYEKIYIYAKDLTEKLYVFLKNFFDKSSQIKDCDFLELVEEACANGTCDCDNIVDAEFHNTLDIPDLDSLDNSIQHLFIFDDFITTKDQSLVEELFMRGRKRNASTIYLSQSYFKVPDFIRDNTQYFALFSIPNKKGIRAIADSQSCRVDSKTLVRLYKEAIKTPFSFLLIDTKTTIPALHIRKNWDGLITPEGYGDELEY